MPRLIFREIFCRQIEKTGCRSETAAMFGMFRKFTLLLEMHKCAGKLDKPFEECVVLRVSLQPQVLEHVVRFVVALAVEAREVALIAGVKRKIRIRAQIPDELFHALVFLRWLHDFVI